MPDEVSGPGIERVEERPHVSDLFVHRVVGPAESGHSASDAAG